MLEDVPSPIDLRLMPDAREWAETAMQKRPWRTEIFAKFASEIANLSPKPDRILELGSGPGFLAKHLLNSFSEVTYFLLDFSPAMHELAAERLGTLANRVQYVERNFKESNWTEGLGKFPCIVTNQVVHELRHKRHAIQFHKQVRGLLESGGSYLVCDHFVGEGGMKNDQLFMTVEEQKQALVAAGFTSVNPVIVKGGLVLHHAR